MALPPDPDFVLRGSQSAVTSLTYFSNSNQCNSLVSGNAGGVIHTWCMRSHRPQCVTETHRGSAMLNVEQFGVDGMVTHSRGICVDVWKNPGAGWIRQGSAFF
ncbi:hypothetical protein NP493_649g01074 [Ridgeia piscesae]|uniref:Uncharacterized protein n=1 Tax=Ridgeia piscesae TaxID=27915 RepID=A0AAD9KSI2_RIDPI|nr:hypothetical protein NP493_649g01074 [Ridgeia piscesae]